MFTFSSSSYFFFIDFSVSFNNYSPFLLCTRCTGDRVGSGHSKPRKGANLIV